MKRLVLLVTVFLGAFSLAQATPARPHNLTEDYSSTVLEDSNQSSGQSSRSVVGSVVDPSGAGVPGAQVLLIGADGTEAARTKTDSTGNFRFEEIAPGVYSLEIMASGFRETRLEVTVGKTLSPVRVNLPIASQNEVVAVGVQDAAPRITTDVAENQNANTIDRRRARPRAGV